MSTLISEFRDPLRHLLGDRHASVYQYSDGNLDAAVKTMVKMGKLAGFALTPAQDAVTPDVSDPNDYALLLYETVRSFVAGNPDRYSYRTRALSETFGRWREFLDYLETNIHELKNGAMFDGWQSFAGWWRGNVGEDLLEVMTRVEVQAPVQTVTVNSDGTHVT
jgi:hypothetical protein